MYRVASLLVPVWMVVALAACSKEIDTDSFKASAAQERAATGLLWQPDLGNGLYKNPVLYADYSDPDVVAVGRDFYMTASSFNSAPGLPVLHSRDLVNWTLLGHALRKLIPEEVFAVPQHGNGVWAPNIRYHDGTEELYDHQTDPRELKNLARDPEHKELVRQLSGILQGGWKVAGAE